MAINLLKMEYELFVRLERVIDKLKRHLNEELVNYSRIMKANYDEISYYERSRAENFEDTVLKSATKRWTIVKLGHKQEVKIWRELLCSDDEKAI